MLMKYTIVSVIALLIVGCGDSRTNYERKTEIAASATASAAEHAAQQAATTEQAKLDTERAAQIAAEQQIAAIRQADPSLDWINIGISTGKYSESLHTSVHKTYEECMKSSWMADNGCVPIAALPESYWDAADQHPAK
jgi:hypothetical protein